MLTNPPPPRSPKSSIDIPALQEDLSDVLASAAELSNTRAAKVVGYRSEQHASLDLGSFLVFFNESWRFVVGCEVICRRMIVGLRGAVVSQVRTSNTLGGVMHMFMMVAGVVGEGVLADVPPGTDIAVCEIGRGRTLESGGGDVGITTNSGCTRRFCRP
jgi:hypothetical protein